MKSINKELKQRYLETPRPMGIFQIRNLTNEKIFLGKSLNLPGALNRHRFALQMGNHNNAALQADWQAQGAAAFAFEILDELTPRDAMQQELREDLDFMETCWLQQLQPYGERGYNEIPLSREARLQKIMRRNAEA